MDAHATQGRDNQQPFRFRVLLAARFPTIQIVLRVTLDTNVFDADEMNQIRAATTGLDVELAPTTVTPRERPTSAPPGQPITETAVWDESRWNEGVWGPSPPVPETFTLGESRLGVGKLGSDQSVTRFEAILAVISNGSFPKPGHRDRLSHGERTQLRDTMILEAHARERRDVLVSNDVTGFIGKDGAKRPKLERFAGPRS